MGHEGQGCTVPDIQAVQKLAQTDSTRHSTHPAECQAWAPPADIAGTPGTSPWSETGAGQPYTWLATQKLLKLCECTSQLVDNSKQAMLRTFLPLQFGQHVVEVCWIKC